LVGVPVPNDIPALQTPLLREEVYAFIKKWIVEGVLQPGERLSDGELTARLGVSRTPVREAFRRLEDEGLLETSRHRWTRVSPVDVEQAEHIYPVVWSLESLAAVHACPNLEDSDFAAMEAANEELERALEQGDSLTAAAKDEEFHHVIVIRSGNPHLVSVLDQFKVKLRRLEIAYFGRSAVASQSIAEHRRILRALKARDEERAARVVAENWQKSLIRFREGVRKRESAGSARGSSAGAEAKSRMSF
jgi:DNA-binding GntR family transcriptional regulator